MLASHEIIIPILEQLKQVVADKRIEGRVGIRTFIGNDGGMAPEITIVFKGPFWSEEQIEAEMTVWQGTDEYTATIIVTVGNLPSGNLLMHEVANIEQFTEAAAYFEKIMSFYK